MNNLQVATWPVEKLIPYARNARTHSDDQVAQIAASIAELGGPTQSLPAPTESLSPATPACRPPGNSA